MTVSRRRYFGRRLAVRWSLSVSIAILIGRHAPGQTFSTGANFTSMSYTSTTGEPPDTMGAVGPNNFVVTQNDGFAIFDKSGALVSSMTPEQFWTTALGSAPGGLTDPRIVYDPMSQRWFTTMVTTDQTTNNKILFARSNSADPTQGFKGVAYTTTNNRFADFPTLGMDANGVYVGTNNFSSSGTLRSIGLYSVPKADLVASTPSLARITAHSTLSANTVGFSLQPTIDYGPKAPNAMEPVVASNNSTSGRYNFSPLNGTGSAGATLGSTTVRTVQATSDPTASPQPGTTNTIDNGDDRFSSAVVQIGNFLYWTQNITVSGRSAIRWTIADATNFNVLQQGTISDPSLSYFYPSISVNAIGDVVIGFSGSNSSTYASTYAMVGTSAGGVLGGALTIGAPVQTKAGVAYYDGSRWGDYSATTPDPADPGIFWTQQEFATTRNFSGTNWNWATQATEIIPNKLGERRWSNTGGGSFDVGANYFTGAAPAATDDVIFSRGNTNYSVTFNGSNTTDRASVRQGIVTWNLAGGDFTLTNSSPTAPSLAVAEFQGTATLNLAGGALNSVNTSIGSAAGGNGAVNAQAGANWTNSAAISVGVGGVGSLSVAALASVFVGTSLTIGPGGTLSVSGGTLRFDTFSSTPSSIVNFTAGTIQVAGNRTIDSDGAIASFFGASPTIGVGKQLTIEGSATVSTLAPVTLAGGTLAAGSGLMINAGGQISGSGTIDTPDSAAAPLINSGAITGNSAADRITANGYITGTGSMDSVHVAGTYSPGPGAASVTLGSVDYSGTLEIEIGGAAPGSEFDLLNHTLGSGAVSLAGTLEVSLLISFTPAANETFAFLTAVGGVTGTFANTILPMLPDGLSWNVVYGANSVELDVVAPVMTLAGDFDGNGVVDMADYVLWRDGLGTTFTDTDYDVWRAHFGETLGSGPSISKTSAAVPEPMSALLALCCILVALCVRHRDRVTTGC